MRKTGGSARRTSGRSRALPRPRSVALTLQAARPSAPLRKPGGADAAWRGGGGAGRGLTYSGRGLCATGSGSPGEPLELSAGGREGSGAGRDSGRGLPSLGAGPLAAVSNAWAAGRADVMSQSKGRGSGRSLSGHRREGPAQVALELQEGLAVLGAGHGRGLCAALAAALPCFRVRSFCLDLCGLFSHTRDI